MFQRKKTEGAVGQLEGELVAAQAKRTKLTEQLGGAEAALNDAVAARRTALLESDGDIGDSHDILVRGLDRDSIGDAVEQLDSKIKDIEGRLVQARDQAARDAAIADLTLHVQQLEQGIEQFRGVTKVLGASAREVCGRTPYANTQFSINLTDFLGAIASDLAGVVGSARQHIDRLKAGTTQARAVVVPAPMPPPAPVPQVERVAILVFGNVRWVENGETCTIPVWGFGSPPRAVAMRAIAAGWAVKQDDPLVGRLRDGGFSIGQSYHKVRADLCTDLDRDPIARPPRGTLGRSLGEPPDSDEATPATLPGGATEHIGEPIIGTASAGRV